PEGVDREPKARSGCGRAGTSGCANSRRGHHGGAPQELGNGTEADGEGTAAGEAEASARAAKVTWNGRHPFRAPRPSAQLNAIYGFIRPRLRIPGSFRPSKLRRSTNRVISKAFGSSTARRSAIYAA